MDAKRTVIDENGEESDVIINANERIEYLTEQINATSLPAGIFMGMDGRSDEQNESQAFLMSAFSAALALMFIILLAQFNSFYNSFVVLIAVVLSTVGVLIGMLVGSNPSRSL